MKHRAYLDIETTGLSRRYADLTVIGIAYERARRTSIVQLTGYNLSESRLLRALDGVDELYTYNGSRFDLPFIQAKLGLELAACFRHTDLMHDCWRQGLKGGLKAVERQLGIERMLRGVDGYMAVRLWYQYLNNNDKRALRTLLDYNREDVVNLRLLRQRLGVK